ncbi:hypothetical protein C1645_735497 [Glomus cerebriforme]|uniref:F-box domain-containing protein n=1 Tax=Glomus cerebriforme TaxID=658196 RepID=A0A397T835_9GLOM|nr:hypothetical protein C1645_735497 [Glomus cerebriforme]
MANNLPDLCLQNIFTHLNYRTLYSCTLVNKQWSYSSIPVLWSNPFDHAPGKLSYLKPLLDISVSFLPQNQQQELGIRPKFRPNSMMFNYPVYIRHFNLHAIYKSVNYWCSRSYPTGTDKQISKALIEYFFINSSKIDTLEIDESDYNNLILDIFHSTQVLSKIQNIRALTINEGYHEFSTLLSNSIQNIKTLKFYIPPRDNPDLLDDIKQLIQNQKNLFDITISQPLIIENQFPIYWEIFHSSEIIKSTVTCIEFVFIKFPKNISIIYHLSYFTNLRYLQFHGCDFGMIPDIKTDQVIQEINSTSPLAFKQLNTIKIVGTLNLELLMILLQLSGEELSCLELMNIKMIKFSYIIKWLEVFCLNLRNLVITDPTNENLEIASIQDFFQKFNNLTSVILNGKRFLA